MRIPVEKVWPALTRRPDPFSGTVTPLESHDDDTEPQPVVSQALDPGTGHVEGTEACAQRLATPRSAFPISNPFPQAPFLPYLPETRMRTEANKNDGAAEEPVGQAAAPADKDPLTAVGVGEGDPGVSSFWPGCRKD